MIPGDFGELLDVFVVVTADIDVKEYRVAVFVLLTNQIIEVLPDRGERLGQSRLLIYSIDRKVKDRNACIREFIDNIGPQQAGIGWHVDPKTLLGCIVGSFVNQLRAEQWLAAHEGQHTASS